MLGTKNLMDCNWPPCESMDSRSPYMIKRLITDNFVFVRVRKDNPSDAHPLTYLLNLFCDFASDKFIAEQVILLWLFLYLCPCHAKSISDK